MNPFRWLWRVLFEDEEQEPRPDEIVELGHVDGEGAAELWRAILEQRGIHSMAKNTSAIASTRHGSPWMVCSCPRIPFVSLPHFSGHLDCGERVAQKGVQDGYEIPGRVSRAGGGVSAAA